MANLHIRNVPDTVVRKLKKRAEGAGRSLQEEVRQILDFYARFDQVQFIEDSRRIRERLKSQSAQWPDSTTLIRKAREARTR